MRKSLLSLLFLAAPLLLAASSPRLTVLVDGTPRPEYHARGATYVEAVKGAEYEILITNPYPTRVAVALSVDGLNTIDARHTDARSGRKWVLDPYQTITIRGWQTSNREARRFFFTSESKSYGAWLGQTDNLGIISAAFFRERMPMIQPQEDQRIQGGAKAQNAPASPRRDDDLAATGIGRGVDHPVTQVWLDLEDAPATIVNVRYEYRAALVALGVFSNPITPLARREGATGFCPTPR
jgi:hypothetical protein